MNAVVIQAPATWGSTSFKQPPPLQVMGPSALVQELPGTCPEPRKVLVWPSLLTNPVALMDICISPLLLIANLFVRFAI